MLIYRQTDQIIGGGGVGGQMDGWYVKWSDEYMNEI